MISTFAWLFFCYTLKRLNISDWTMTQTKRTGDLFYFMYVLSVSGGGGGVATQYLDS